MSIDNEKWLDLVLPMHARLTKTVVSIVESLLHESDIDYLTVTGRTKEKISSLEKIKRKNYVKPAHSLTDLSGIRIVLYFESDVKRVGNLIRAAFQIDEKNSLDKDILLSTNRVGYRSVHFVCGLGAKRAKIEEYKGFSNLNFEIQVRTVLQHAWAELAHDRKYKFSEKLPPEIERQLYLYAGLLEVADKGFDETAKLIDNYAKILQDRTNHGDLDFGVDSLSLAAYVNHWSIKNEVRINDIDMTSELSELVQELNEFGIHKISELAKIVPASYATISKQIGAEHTVLGIVRDWMLIKDWRRFCQDVKINWFMSDSEIIEKIIPDEDLLEFRESFNWGDDD